MPYTLTNLSRYLLLVPLNGGETLHLAPGESSGVDPLEVEQNPRIERLLNDSLLRRTDKADPSAASRLKPVAPVIQKAPTEPRRTPRKKPILTEEAE